MKERTEIIYFKPGYSQITQEERLKHLFLRLGIKYEELSLRYEIRDSEGRIIEGYKQFLELATGRRGESQTIALSNNGSGFKIDFSK